MAEDDAGLALEPITGLETEPGAEPGADAGTGIEAEPLGDEPGAPQSEPAPGADSAAKTEPLPSSEVAKYLRSLRGDETGGRFSRALEGAYFRDREFSKAFPTVEAAREASMLLEGVGGLEGIEELQNAGALIQELDEMAARGDPELIDRLAGDNPEGFAGLTRAGLEKLRVTNQQAYDDVIRPHVVSALAGSNLGFALRSAADLLAGGNQQGAYDYLQEILGWVNNLGRGAAQPPTAQNGRVAANGPGSFSGAAPRGDAAGAPAADFGQRLAAAAEPGVSKAIQDAVQPYAAQRQLPQASQSRLQALVLSELDRQLGSDDGYQRTLRALSRGGNVDRAARFVASKVQQVASRVAREVVNDVYPSPQKTVARTAAAQSNGRAAAPAAAPGGGKRPQMVRSRPTFEQVDWSKDPDRLLYIGKGEAYLTDGRYVRWPK